MGADIQAPCSEVKPKQVHHPLAERALRFQWEWALGLNHWLAGLPLDDLCNQPGQPLSQWAKDGLDFGLGESRLKPVDQGLIAAYPQNLREALGFLPSDRHHGAEVLKKPCPVVCGALASPGVLTPPGCNLLLGNEALRQRLLPAPLMVDFAQVCGLVVVQRLLQRLLHEGVHLGVGRELVHKLGQFGHSRRAGIVPLGRHVGRLIPVADCTQMAKPIELSLLAGQGVVCGGH